MIYLDHAATTSMYPEALHKMLPYFQKKYYNPSSTYATGLTNHQEIESVRQSLSKYLGSHPSELYFTSGGTESDNWALLHAFRHAKLHRPQNQPIHIITSQIEHHAILHTCDFLQKMGCQITYMPVNKKGFVNPRDIENAIRPETAIISIMYANNEIGTIQPIREIGAIAHRYKIPFHTDAVQVFGHLPIDVEEAHIDYLSVSAHKFGGPKGVGFLYAREEIGITPFLFGGSQERKRRAGTENVPGIIGMGEAAKISFDNMECHRKKEERMRDYLISRILSKIDMVSLNGSISSRLPGNINVSFYGIDGASLIMMLEMRGIFVSGGSACTSADQGPSHVLTAIGLPTELARGALRITLGSENTMEEMHFVFHCIQEAVEELRGLNY